MGVARWVEPERIVAMKPSIGELAPDFTAPVAGHPFEDGEMLTLSSLRGETVALVFYPKDQTPGCTTQACALRDAWSDLEGKLRVFGVSADSIASHRKFISKKELPYPLISDESRAIVEAYGVWVEKSFMGKTFMGIERSTFVIGPDGKILAVLEKVSPATHLEQLLKSIA